MMAEGRAKTWAQINRQLDAGVSNMFKDSSGERVHADLYARTGGCLCWGTWALVIAPASYEVWAKNELPCL